MSEFVSNITEYFYHSREQSAGEYSSPIKPREGEMVRFWRDSPSHRGSYKHAVDIIVPDPTDSQKGPLPVYAPFGGRVVALVQGNDKWGSTQDFAGFLNYITVETSRGEFYELCHIGKNSCSLKIGDRVDQGEKIALTGANGWMTDPRHIHFMVGRWTNKNKGEFESLRIRWQNKSLIG